MATAAVTNTFVTGTTILAAAMNTNFSDLVGFLNTQVLHLDGSKAMVGALDMGSQRITNLAAPTADADAARRQDAEQQVTFTLGGDQKVGAQPFRWYPPYNITIIDCRLSVGTAPAGADLIWDVNKSGTTIYSTQANRPTVPAAANVGAATAPDVTSVLSTEYLHVDVDQVGSTTAGKDAVLVIRFRRA